MKNLILPLLIIFVSCSSNDDGDIPLVTKPDTNSNIYTYYNEFNITDLNYYKGDDGKEYPTEAKSFLNSQWSFYEKPLIKSITFLNDTITINEDLNIKKYKYINENNTLKIKEGNNDITLGYLDSENGIFKLYKNFKSYYIISNKETNETLFKRNYEYGKMTYDDFFPRILKYPNDLTDKNEYIFWSNIEYTFHN